MKSDFHFIGVKSDYYFIGDFSVSSVVKKNLRLSAQSALSVFYFLLPATAGSFGMTGCLAIQAILTHKPEYALRHSEDARVGRLYS